MERKTQKIVLTLVFFGLITMGLTGFSNVSGAKVPPTVNNPYPINNTINVNIGFNWTCYISDIDGDNFNYTLQFSNGSTVTGTNKVNGTYYYDLNLSYETKYTVWVNVTDYNLNGSYNRYIFYFTTKDEPVSFLETGGFGNMILTIAIVIFMLAFLWKAYDIMFNSKEKAVKKMAYILILLVLICIVCIAIGTMII